MQNLVLVQKQNSTDGTWKVVPWVQSSPVLQRLSQWDPESMLTKQTGWCYMMSSREHAERFGTLIYIGLARRQKALHMKMTTTVLLGLAATWIRISPTAQHHRHHQRRMDKPTMVYITQTQQWIRGRAFFFLSFFKLKNRRRKKIWEWSAVRHLLRLPLQHFLLGLLGALTADSQL